MSDGAKSSPVFHKAPETVLAAWLRPDVWSPGHSSGGFFRVLARFVLDNGGVVFGAAFDGQFSLAHRGAETERDCAALYGSKYLRSDTAAAYRDVRDALDAGRRVLYSGTPCQVAALYGFLGGRREGLVTADLVCGGTPPAAVFRAYLERLRAGRGVVSVSFRDGPWKRPRFTAAFSDGSGYSRPLYETPFGRGFGMGLTLPKACGQCPYARAERVADFTLGDFWGYSGPAPRKGGVSLVLVNSGEARQMTGISGDGEQARHPLIGCLPAIYESVERPLAEAVRGNPRLSSPVKLHKDRDAFFRDFETNPYEETERRWLARPPLPYRVLARLTPSRIKRLLGR
ncbi:MAG: Coenzyme F420 hydrogenase/dehydrogenase, beta subunit C-terminal domain [Oscillospiraceae bacterium]|jgi:coenzyme F420-reducing hydrogenase beta subunit|nr:Coenzyme F420 hydrogenase/dehydrogenase, beta subunit C-terminal domain [Oscillospiraceae bacterium]